MKKNILFTLALSTVCQLNAYGIQVKNVDLLERKRPTATLSEKALLKNYEKASKLNALKKKKLSKRK